MNLEFSKEKIVQNFSPELVKLAKEFAEKQIALLITKGQLKAPVKKTNLEIASKTMDGGRYVKALKYIENINGHEIAVLHNLVSRIDFKDLKEFSYSTGEIKYLTYEEIAFAIKFSKDTVEKSLKSLAKKGFIQIISHFDVQNKRRGANSYKVMPKTFSQAVLGLRKIADLRYETNVQKAESAQKEFIELFLSDIQLQWSHGVDTQNLSTRITEEVKSPTVQNEVVNEDTQTLLNGSTPTSNELAFHYKESSTPLKTLAHIAVSLLQTAENPLSNAVSSSETAGSGILSPVLFPLNVSSYVCSPSSLENFEEKIFDHTKSSFNNFNSEESSPGIGDKSAPSNSSILLAPDLKTSAIMMSILNEQNKTPTKSQNSEIDIVKHAKDSNTSLKTESAAISNQTHEVKIPEIKTEVQWSLSDAIKRIYGLHHKTNVPNGKCGELIKKVIALTNCTIKGFLAAIEEIEKSDRDFIFSFVLTKRRIDLSTFVEDIANDISKYINNKEQLISEYEASKKAKEEESKQMRIKELEQIQRQNEEKAMREKKQPELGTGLKEDEQSYLTKLPQEFKNFYKYNFNPRQQRAMDRDAKSMTEEQLHAYVRNIMKNNKILNQPICNLNIQLQTGVPM